MQSVIRRFLPFLLLVALFGCTDSTGGGGTGDEPQITSFTANPGSITAAGQAVTLSWTVTSGVTGLEIDQGVGPVSGTSTVVYPQGATVYTLTATNSSGTDTETVEVGLGTGGGGLVEDGLAPSGTFGLSLTQSDFQSDQGSNIESADDPRIVRVEPGGTFYALVSYSDPGGIAGVRIRIANSSPAGLGADLVQGREVNGFTLVGEVGGCVLDGTQTSVTCIYQIAVGDIPNITELPGAGSEFAYVFRVNVTDAAGNESDSPPRGYVIVESGSGGGDDGGGGGGGGGGTPPNNDPVAAFTNSQTASDESGVSYRFSAAGSRDSDGDTLSYAWTFGDGTGGNSRVFTKKYREDGTYTVRLTVSDGNGGSDTETKTVAVDVPGGGGGGGGGTPPSPIAPAIASFTANPQVVERGQNSTLIWSVTGTVTSLLIDQGVGNVMGAGNKQVSPTTTTTYTLTAANGEATATKQTTVTVDNGGGNNPPPTNSGPNADFTMSSNDLQVEFTSTSSDPDGSIVSYTWAFGDNTSSTVQNPSKTYSKAGTYNVKLTVTDNNGATGSVTKPVTVTSGDQGSPPVNSEPTADFSAEVNNLQVVFTSTSTDSDGAIASASWSFGDGTTADAPSLTKTYAQPGTYDVTLTVTDNAGAVDSITKPVTVDQPQPPPNQTPNADFDTYIDGLFVEFTSTSTDADGTIEDYSWTFGDGETANSRNSFKFYDSAGTYNVTLSVTDDRGASDSITRSITVEDGDDGGGGGCCRVCTVGKPCGDSCIARDKVCRKPGGCACSALMNPQDFEATLEYQLLNGSFAFDLLTGRTKPCSKAIVPLIYASN